MIHQRCPHCQKIEAQIKQHEKYIAQLVDILAKTNEKVVDLEKRQLSISAFPYQGRL
jgi:transposase